MRCECCSVLSFKHQYIRKKVAVHSLKSGRKKVISHLFVDQFVLSSPGKSSCIMREEDLILARAIVAQQQQQASTDSPGASPAPLRRTLVTNLQERTKQFR